MIRDFDIEKVKAQDKLEKILTVRVTKKEKLWFIKNRISATKFFRYWLHKVLEEDLNLGGKTNGKTRTNRKTKGRTSS